MAYPGEALLQKMWESLVDKGIGGLLRPRQIRQEGRATIDVRVEEKLRLAQAEKHAQAILKGEAAFDGNTIVMLPSNSSGEVIPPNQTPPAIEMSVTKQITSATAADAIRKEVNVAKAILEAEAELENDSEPPPEQPINDDWLYRWRDYAGEVSSEELQSMWGKILAGETKAPGSFSLRTMDFLRNVSQEEAHAIGRLAPYVIVDMIYRADLYLEKMGITFDLLLSIQDMGILSGVEALGLQKTFKSSYPGKYTKVIGTKEKILILEHDDVSKTATAPVFVVTTIGKQILGLCKSSIDEVYLRELGKHIIAQGFKVRLATVKNIAGGMVHYENEENLDTLAA